MTRILVLAAALALATPPLTTGAAQAGISTFPTGGWGKDIRGGSGKTGPAGVQSTAGTNPEG